jgi:hypothetical protein
VQVPTLAAWRDDKAAPGRSYGCGNLALHFHHTTNVMGIGMKDQPTALHERGTRQQAPQLRMLTSDTIMKNANDVAGTHPLQLANNASKFKSPLHHVFKDGSAIRGVRRI